MIGAKRPYLVCLDFKAGTAARYLRRFDLSGAGLGWATSSPHTVTANQSRPIVPRADSFEPRVPFA